MTKWEIISPRTRGVSGYRGKLWKEVPCVAVKKSGFTFNRVFAEMFIKNSLQVMVLKDEENPRNLGFKIVPRGDECPEAYVLTNPNAATKKGKKKPSQYYAVNSSRFTQHLKDCWTHYYRAHQCSANEQLILCEFAEHNRGDKS